MIPTSRQILNRQKRILNALSLVVEESLSWTHDELESNLPPELLGADRMDTLEGLCGRAVDTIDAVKGWVDETLFLMSNPGRP